jgi:hypothetical protein
LFLVEVLVHLERYLEKKIEVGGRGKRKRGRWGKEGRREGSKEGRGRREEGGEHTRPIKSSISSGCLSTLIWSPDDLESGMYLTPLVFRLSSLSTTVWRSHPHLERRASREKVWVPLVDFEEMERMDARMESFSASS